MTLRWAGRAGISLAALALLTLPTIAAAQDCVGDKPRGGRYSTSAELYLSRARRNPRPEEKAKLFQQAVDVLKEGFVDQPDNPRNYELAGQAYVGLLDYAAADSAYTMAEQMWSCYAARIDTLRFNAWVLAFNRAVGYAQNNELDKAIEDYKTAWTVYKKMPQPMLQLGNMYANKALTAETDAVRDEFQELAIESYSNALEVMTERPPRLSEAQLQEYGRAAAFNLAQLLAFEERYEEAARAYDSFLAQEPGNVDAMSNAAVVLTRAAMQAADQAEELEAGPEKDRLVAKSDSLRAVANSYYSELLGRDDLAATDYHNIGLGLMQIGLHDEGAIAFVKALDQEPYRMNSLEQLARVHFSAQRFDTLAVIAKTLTERYPLSLDNLALLANAYRETEQLDEALATLERREALPGEITDLEMEAEEGTFTVTGWFTNLSMEPDTPLELQFDFYDYAGEVVASETVTIVAPVKDSQTDFSVTTESPANISGFTYKPLNVETAQTGT